MAGEMKDLRELQAEYHTVTEEKLIVGALVETVLSEEDGLVFKDNRTSKPKKIIIVGTDRECAICFGSILVNTNMSPQAEYSDEHLAAQYLLKKENYPDFLKYDSFVDCAKVFSIPIKKLLSGQYFGQLNEEDIAGIFEILETTETLTTKQKKRFGIRRR